MKYIGYDVDDLNSIQILYSRSGLWCTVKFAHIRKGEVVVDIRFGRGDLIHFV